MTLWTPRQREEWLAARLEMVSEDQRPDGLNGALWDAADAVDALYADEYERVSELHMKLVRWHMTGRGEWTAEDSAELDALHETVTRAHLDADAKTRAEWAAAHVTGE